MFDLGHDKRRVRFASIVGIDRSDLPLAAEVWQSDLNAQVWTKRETIKLGGLFTLYMSNPDSDYLSLNYIERTFQIDIMMVRDVLRQMKMYGVIDGFNVKDGVVRVSLRLSITQRLRVLEMRTRFLELSGLATMQELNSARAPDQWQLTAPDQDLDLEVEELLA